MTIKEKKPDFITVRLSYNQKRQVNERLKKLNLNVSEYLRLLMLLDYRLKVFETLGITNKDINKAVDFKINVKGTKK